MIRVAGVDPGLASVGLAVAEIECVEDLSIPDGLGKRSRIIETTVVRTKPSPKKLKRRRDADIIRRLSEIVDAVAMFLEQHGPAIVAFESAPLVRSASSSQGIGLGWGSVFSLVRRSGAAVEVYDPMEIKLGLGLKKTATKEAVQDAVKSIWPSFDGWPEGKIIEHAADAVGAIVTSLRDDQFRAISRALQTRKG